MAAPVAGGGSETEVIPGAWIVTVEDGESPDQVADEQRRRHGAQVGHVYRNALSGYSARMSDGAAADVARDRRVARIERDRTAHAFGVDGWSNGLSRIYAHSSPTLSASATVGIDVDVAVLDTGITAHADLSIVGGVDCSLDDGPPTYADGHGHGTHVAGTVGAKPGARGMLGVAPGARLHAVKVLSDSGSGTWSDIICGIDWVTGQAEVIEVANMSLGAELRRADTSTCDTAGMHSAICASVRAGVTYVVAAGNSKKDASKFIPAAYDEVITVSALADFDGLAGGGGKATCRRDQDDTIADFSNFGADVDVMAPGVCIESMWKDGGYRTISGTSMASPHVAGAAALWISTQTSRPTVAAVKTALLTSGNKVYTPDNDGIQEPLLDVGGF